MPHIPAPAALSRIVPADCPPSAHCHALSVRLPDGGDADGFGRALDAAVRLWWPEAAERWPVLWRETVRAVASSDAAERRLYAETHRPVSIASGLMLRAVLLEYADGPADLVLTAHRQRLDARSLAGVADVVLGRVPAGEFHVAQGAPADTSPVRSGPGGRIEWAGTGVVVSTALDGTSNDPLACVVAAAALVAGRYEGRAATEVGVLAAGADRSGETLGAFDEAWVQAVDLSEGCTAGQLLDAVRAAWPGSYEGGRPVVGVLGDGGLSGGTAPQATRTPTPDAPHHLPCQTAPFPLTLTLRTTTSPDGGLALDLHHQLRHVDDATARAFVRHVARAYQQLTASPDQPVADIALLDAAEAETRLALGRPARDPHPRRPRPRRIDALFDEQADLRPTATALTHDGRTLTYAHLRERAELRAAGLRAAGVRAGERVGICLERSADLVVVMLAVLKADAVYVPLDPAHPPARLTYTAQDAGLRLIVTDLDAFPRDDTDVRTLSPADLAVAGTEAMAATQAKAARTHPARAPQEAAYVIYTSGSTGRPKGVVVPHANVAALLDATRDDFGLGADDTWTLFHSSAFDFSVWEIWGALLTGARLVVVDYWVSRSPAEFRELLMRERVTVLNQTPSAFGQLMEADRPHRPELPLRLVVFGGEPLDTRPLLGWFDRYPENRCRLVNMFGITETTVHVTAQTVTRREAMAGSRSVGRPLPGWYLYVLDAQGRPVPTGTAGEIWVGGAGVALEYLGRPELTAERFVPDPYRQEGRVYRSGDLGRLRPDGTLEHLGRLDSQVKIRGFRIELDEIRSVLLDDPAVTSAAVVLGGDALKDAAGVRIDAYVVLLEGQFAEAAAAAVRRRAAKLLPDYMVPTTVTPLPALPLTANGKLDVRELPEPKPEPQPEAQPQPEDEPAPAPASTVQASNPLAEVWESVLGVPVGPDDNFFDLGGNSLYAVRVAAALRERGLPPVSLRQLYTTPTVRELTVAQTSGTLPGAHDSGAVAGH
ncbi:amino acid adenylation domain-containing protein [Streptomyces spiramyceticus]|uniref:amino acid adenylation domain-containing protein n=1 Tax=Streptomyces spiramyceticus TaxID=299717 RepID=UPI00237A4FE5|nr:non-ribosomal peptide synthetase [Streptomyces spiramyceticus]